MKETSYHGPEYLVSLSVSSKENNWIVGPLLMNQGSSGVLAGEKHCANSTRNPNNMWQEWVFRVPNASSSITRIICQKPSVENSISVSWWMDHRLWCHGPWSCPDWITVCWWNAENRWCRSKHQSDIGIMRQFGQQTTSLEPQVRKLAGCGSCPLSLHSLLPSA